jgi:27-O-demethylrifamycin SV methyltransferase
MSNPNTNASEMAHHYDSVTAGWRLFMGEELHFGWFERPEDSLSRATHQLTEQMARGAQLSPQTRVLDVGCGIGTQAIFLAKEFGCNVTGISLSEEGLKVARENAQRNGCADRVTFRVADGMNNGLPDASFDRVQLLECSHAMSDKARLLAECARVLRPGGILVMCDVMRAGPTVAAPPSEALDFLTVFGPLELWERHEYEAMLKAAGLTVTSSTDITDKVAPTSKAWRNNAEARRAELLQLLGPDYLEALKRTCDRLTSGASLKHWAYGLIVARKS